jgi:hypothetical protein
MTIKKDNHERLVELLGPNSKNFLGTGLTLEEFMQLGHAEKLATSWSLQKPEERRRRLQAVIQLSIELGRIREITNFSTRLAELAIEAVIEGDQKVIEDWADHFSFAEEPGAIQTCAPIFAVFRELLLQVLRAGKELPT